MARKKATSAVATRDPMMLPANLVDEFAEHINRDKAAARGADTGWEWFKTAGGVLKFNGEPWPEQTPMIVVNATRQNSFFDSAFDPNNPVGPSCAAIDTQGDERTMVPLEGPNKQSESCASCWANAFGSSGKGKACKNTVVLCVLPYGDTIDYSAVSGARINVPPTSLKNWGQYSKRVTDGMERPLFAVATLIEIVKDPKTQWRMEFTPHAPINDSDVLRTLAQRASTDGLSNAHQGPELASNAPEAAAASAGRIPARKPVRKASSQKR